MQRNNRIGIHTVIFLSCVVMISCSRGRTELHSSSSAIDSTTVRDSVSTTSLPLASTRSSYEERQGKHLYDKYCSVCHGSEGKGDGFNAYNLDPKPRDFTDQQYMSPLSDERLLQTIERGGKGVSKSALMPAWDGRLKEYEIKEVAEFVRSLSKKR